MGECKMEITFAEQKKRSVSLAITSGPSMCVMAHLAGMLRLIAIFPIWEAISFHPHLGE